MRIKKNIHYTITNWILYQIPQTNIMRIILQTVRGIDNEILGVKGFVMIMKMKLDDKIKFTSIIR